MLHFGRIFYLMFRSSVWGAWGSDTESVDVGWLSGGVFIVRVRSGLEGTAGRLSYSTIGRSGGPRLPGSVRRACLARRRRRAGHPEALAVTACSSCCGSLGASSAGAGVPLSPPERWTRVLSLRRRLLGVLRDVWLCGAGGIGAMYGLAGLAARGNMVSCCRLRWGSCTGWLG